MSLRTGHGRAEGICRQQIEHPTTAPGPTHSLTGMSRTVAASVLIAFTLTGCGSTVTDSDSPTASSFATSANAATATTAPAQPKTLEAATAVAQEWVDRRAAGDYAGVWLLFSEQVREGISQENYVTVSETCTSSLTKLPSTVNGVRPTVRTRRSLALRRWSSSFRRTSYTRAASGSCSAADTGVRGGPW